MNLGRKQKEIERLQTEGRKMYETFVRERAMLRRALAEYENDEQVAARYAALADEVPGA